MTSEFILVQRGLEDELKETAYAIVAGVDGRTHHLRFGNLDMTGDAPPGAIVEARVYDDPDGRRRVALATRSDLSIDGPKETSAADLGLTKIATQVLLTNGMETIRK